jgi:hypothetical protein
MGTRKGPRVLETGSQPLTNRLTGTVSQALRLAPSVSGSPHELKLAVRRDEGDHLVGLISAQVDTLRSSSSAATDAILPGGESS